MSMRVRLNVLISVLFVTILVLGTALVIGNARRAVLEETQSTARLASQLLEVAYAATAPDSLSAVQPRLRERLAELETARHLRVSLIEGGREVELVGSRPEAAPAPAWFARLVAPDAAASRRAFRVPGYAAEIVVQADPVDEVAESWKDARPLLLLVLIVSVIANAVVYIVIGRWLQPVERVARALEEIEQGDYRARLPPPSLPELAAVVDGFNRMAGALERSREENRQLAQQSIAIQEAERRALARELHDELGQSIAAINAVAASIEPAAGAKGAATISAIAARMHAVVRGMLRRLRPVLLDEFGLVRALQELVDGWNERQSDTFCRLAVHGSVDRVGNEASIGLYRVVQECLTNVSKHAKATDVTIDLTRETDGALRLTVTDDGVGFDGQVVRPGLGLLGMRERIEALGGGFKATSAPGRGVTVVIELPAGASA
jgi:two-component system sensor histidine kinase UhpB